MSNMDFKYLKCNICGSDKTKTVGKRKSPGSNLGLESDIVQCVSCGLMYPNPMPSLDTDSIQRNFSNAEKYFSGKLQKTVSENVKK